MAVTATGWTRRRRKAAPKPAIADLQWISSVDGANNGLRLSLVGSYRTSALPPKADMRASRNDVR
jgi:hypothetical protein